MIGDEDDTLTVEEAAALLKVNPATVQRELRANRLPGNTVGRAWRIRRGDLREYLKGETPTRTEGERAFESYLASVGLPFRFEEPVAGTTRKPDFCVTIDGEDSLFEVKQFDPQPEDFRTGFGTFDPYPPLREKIDAARKKFKGLKGTASCSLVLYNNGKPLIFLDAIHIYGAMLGDVGITFPFDTKTGRGDVSRAKQEFLGGGKMLRYAKGMNQAIAPQNTTVSSIVVVSRLNLGQRRFSIAARRRERELRRDLSSHETWAMLEEWSSMKPGLEETALRVCVYENPVRVKPLSEAFGRGPLDQQFAMIDREGLGRRFVGSELTKLEAEEAEVHIKCDPWTGVSMHQSQALRARLDAKSY